MKKFIRVFQDEMTRISVEKVEEEIEDIDDEEGSALVYAGLKNSHWERILSRCRLYFEKSELNELRRFVEENRHPRMLWPSKLNGELRLSLFRARSLSRSSRQERNRRGIRKPAHHIFQEKIMKRVPDTEFARDDRPHNQ